MSDIVRKQRSSQPPPSSASEEKEASGSDTIAITVNGVAIKVSPELEDAVKRAQKESHRPLSKEMTTTQAAEFLDVSRPFVIKLTQRGELPCRKVGKHRRIPASAVVEYREKMYQQSQKAADEMAQISQTSGLYDESPRREAQ